MIEAEKLRLSSDPGRPDGRTGPFEWSWHHQTYLDYGGQQ